MQIRITVLLVLCFASCAVWLVPMSVSSERNPYLQVHFLDVGQGDAIFIETPDGVQALIDGGRDTQVLQQLSSVMPLFDRTIDMVVGTHPDTDHIGGLVDVLEQYEVSAILTTENKGESETAQLYERLKTQEGAQVHMARRGQVFTLGASTTIEVLFPETNPLDMESNASSIVLQLRHGSSTFLLTGDAPKRIEEYLVLALGDYLHSDVLKVGHHGSRTSTSELFLDSVRPQIAIISAGKNNSYGHPHVEVTDALFNAGVTILQTAEEGTITLLSDGVRVWRKE